MRQIFKIFFTAEGTRPWAVLLCLLFGGFAEAIGIGTLLPVAGSILNTNSGQPSQFESYIRTGFGWLGIEPTFENLVILVLTIMTVRSLLLFSAMSYAGITSARVANAFRRNIIRAVLEARWSYYANQSTGQLANTLGNDVSRAGESYLTFATVTTCTIQIVAYATIAFLINWRVALAGIFGGVAVALMSSKLVQISRRSGFKQTDRLGVMTSDIVDMLHNIKALKSMNRYVPLLQHLESVLDKLKHSLYAASLSRYGLSYGNDLLVSLLVGLGAYVAHVYARVSLPEMFVFGVLFFQVISYASKLQKQVQLAAQYEGAYIRVTEALENARAARETETGTITPDLGTGLKVNNVSFRYGEKNVLQNVSLEVPANAITVLQGSSGAGKTTLLDLLIGFNVPQSGDIMVGSNNLRDIDMQKWRSMIGYVPQELALLHDTVTANISLYDESLSREAIDKAMHLSGVSAFLEKLPKGADTDVGEFGGKLSGGQRQRISLARALVGQPKLLILDEVTSALDPETEDAIVSNIAELRGQYTIIAITHRPAWTRIADRLYTIKDGTAQLQGKSKGHTS